jgi:hypothetical protein
MFEWKGLLRALLRPSEVIKRKCLIDGLAMERDSAGVYRCPKGHVFDPALHGGSDPMIDATKGDFHADL